MGLSKNMIHVINRHCKFSNLSANKSRPSFFSREKCFKNLVNTIGDDKRVKLHLLFDGDITGHFLSEYFCLENLVMLKSGSGAKSFVDAVNYAVGIGKPGDIIYFLEDDYLHKYKWVDILLEGMTISPTAYVSLYDAFDKYYMALPPSIKPMYTMYENYQSKMTTTKSSHWRSACSTTDTFAMSYEQVVATKEALIYFSSLAPHSLDHQRGLFLNSKGYQLWTCIPGYSTHMEPDYMSPVIDWECIQEISTK